MKLGICSDRGVPCSLKKSWWSTLDYSGADYPSRLSESPAVTILIPLPKLFHSSVTHEVSRQREMISEMGQFALLRISCWQ